MKLLNLKSYNLCRALITTLNSKIYKILVVFRAKDLKKLMICIATIIMISALTGCKDDKGDKEDSDIGINITKGQITKSIDTHGSLGDGVTYNQIEFKGEIADSVESELEEYDNWIQLPLSDNLDIAVYGTKHRKSLLQSFEEGIPAIPEITKGYYFFKDRNSESTDSSDDTYLHSRYSYNFDILIYDVDKHILYIFQLDT